MLIINWYFTLSKNMVENGKQKFEFHFIQMKSIHCEVKVTFTCICICDQRLHFLI